MKILEAILIIAISVFLTALFYAVPIWILWNWLLPHILGLPEVTFFEAWGIGLLFGLLFKDSSSSSNK